MKRFFFIFLFIFSGLILSAQEKIEIVDSIKPNWLSLEQVKDTFAKRQKPIMLFMYDEQNDSSIMMLDSIMADKTVAQYLNVFFYSTKIERRTKKDLRFFNDSLFKYNPKLTVHPLLLYLTGNKPYFPSYVFFQPNGKGEVFVGHYNKKQFLPILIYYAEQAYKTVDYQTYLKYFKMVYPDKSTTGYTMVRSSAKWVKLNEALEKQKTAPKKILIDFYLNERNLSTIQYMRTYNNPVIGKYMSEHFYNVHLLASNQDTIKAFGGVYAPNSPKPFHQLVVAMLAGKMYFPSLIILDEKGKMVERIQAYLPPEQLEPILHYFAEDAYKKMNFKTFKKTFKSELPPNK